MWNYDQPSISSVSPRTAPTHARQPDGSPVIVSVTGYSLGVQRVVLFGGQQVTELPGGNHSFLSFAMPPGQGTRNVLLVVGNQVFNTTSSNFSVVHDPPSISFMTPDSGTTSACRQLESVSGWQARLSRLAADAPHRSRLCCDMDTYRIEGVCVWRRWKE